MEIIICDFLDKNGIRCQKIGQKDFEGSICIGQKELHFPYDEK